MSQELTQEEIKLIETTAERAVEQTITLLIPPVWRQEVKDKWKQNLVEAITTEMKERVKVQKQWQGK